MKKEIIIKHKITPKEIGDLSMYLLSKQPIIYIIPLALLLVLLSNGMLTFIAPNYQAEEKDIFDYVKIFLIPTIFVLVIFFTNKKIRKNAVKNPKLKEDIILIFNQECFEQKGQTFNVKYPWSEIHQIKETKRWFLIYPNKKQAIPIIKKDLDESQLDELRLFLKKLDIKKDF